MPVTLADMIDQITLEIGENSNPRNNPTRIANEAGRYLFAMHQWRWRERLAILDFVNGQDYLTMPDEFGDLIAVSMTANTVSRVVSVTLEEIINRRAYAWFNPFCFYVAISYPTQATTTSEAGQPRLEIYPTPQDDQPHTVRIAYRAKWVEMDELDDVANITFKAESLLIRITRALANFYQTGDRKLIDGISQSPEYAMLRQEDGFSQPRMGALAGGAAYQNVIVPWLPFNYVGGPTQT